MKIEQFVMAYGIEQDRIRALLPAFPEEAIRDYPKQSLTALNAAAIRYSKVLGSYIVRFER